MEDIDDYSAHLGIPWQHSKDLPFSSSTSYLGFMWDLAVRTMSLSERKKIKYAEVLDSWCQCCTHTLKELEQLYGKLLHASLVIPQGHAYITGLEAMFPLFCHEPFKPRTPPRAVPQDLTWWTSHLRSAPPLPIPTKEEIADVEAFSDASNSGIAITISPYWRAWALDPGWREDGQDIRWAEAIAFELLICTVAHRFPSIACFRLYCDNQGVVEDGGKGGVATQPSMESLGEYTTWSEIWESRSSLSTSHQPEIPQPHHHEAFTPHGTSAYHPLRSIKPFIPLSPMPAWAQAVWTGTTGTSQMESKALSQTLWTPMSLDLVRTTSSSSSRPSKRAAVLANVGISDSEVSGSVLMLSAAANQPRYPAPTSHLRPLCPAKE